MVRALHRYRRGQGSNPGKPDFFRLSFRNCISCVNNCEDLLSFISSFRSSNICISYIHNFIFISPGYITNQFNDQLPVGLLAQLVRALHRYRRGQGSNPGKPDFFRLSFRNCISCVNNCEDLLSFISSFRSSNICISYIHNFIFISPGYITNQFNDQLPVGLLAQLVRALHRYRRGQGSNPGKPDFFRLSFRNCISCVNNCEDLLSFISSFRTSNICISYIHNFIFISPGYITNQFNDQLPVGLLAQLV